MKVCQSVRTQTPHADSQTVRQPDRQMPTLNNNINIGIRMTAAALTYMLVKSGEVRGSYLPLQFLCCTFRPRGEREIEREREKERERESECNGAAQPPVPALQFYVLRMKREVFITSWRPRLLFPPRRFPLPPSQ
ncbi:hypothetical protein QQF64_023144 [Cirrhinus molitorella]|uniref:Uncharacterized protein n=1 Tax=Cirrhinus molitorella TaxID=172907 RepID=A0ABR3L4J9_9TELE